MKPAVNHIATEVRQLPSRHVGLKALYLEPWLILGSVILWLTVLPVAGLIWSGTTLAEKAHAHG